MNTTRALIVWLVLLCAATASLAIGATWAWGQYRAAGGGLPIGPMVRNNNEALADPMLKLHPEYRSLTPQSFDLLLQSALLTTAQGQLCAGLWPEFQSSARVLRVVADAVFAVGDRLKLSTPKQHNAAQALPQVMQSQLDHGFLNGAAAGEYSLCLITQQGTQNAPERHLPGL